MYYLVNDKQEFLVEVKNSIEENYIKCWKTSNQIDAINSYRNKDCRLVKFYSLKKVKSFCQKIKNNNVYIMRNRFGKISEMKEGNFCER